MKRAEDRTQAREPYNPWRSYERCKRQVAAEATSPTDYEARLAALVGRLGL
jgi:hypothetical protein